MKKHILYIAIIIFLYQSNISTSDIEINCMIRCLKFQESTITNTSNSQSCIIRSALCEVDDPDFINQNDLNIANNTNSADTAIFLSIKPTILTLLTEEQTFLTQALKKTQKELLNLDAIVSFIAHSQSTQRSDEIDLDILTTTIESKKSLDTKLKTLKKTVDDAHKKVSSFNILTMFPLTTINNVFQRYHPNQLDREYLSPRLQELLQVYINQRSYCTYEFFPEKILNSISSMSNPLVAGGGAAAEPTEQQ